MTNNEDPQVKTGEEIPQPDLIYCPGCNKLDSFNWLKHLPAEVANNQIVEVRFKNTRKGFYLNVNNLRLEIGDIVAVEASPGHDIGRVSLTGPLVWEQMKKLKAVPSPDEMKKVYRKAKPVDLQKWEEAKSLEIPVMLRTRSIAAELKLNMKISDVEYQGDKTKAIFYYIADERVDFRQLIRVLADEFRIRVEMRQIGARQEAGRVGGIGSCGRELCCATFITTFSSVTTSHAKYQELSLNPQKLAGQCGKLKCCLNYEFDCYMDAQKGFPPKDIPLELAGKTLYYQKIEVHKGIFWYSSEPGTAINLVAVPVARVKEIQEMNRRGIKPELLTDEPKNDNPIPSPDILGNDSLTRFDTVNNTRQEGGRKIFHRKRRKHNQNKGG